MAILEILVNTLSNIMCGVNDLLETSPTGCVLHLDLVFANANRYYDFSPLASLLQSFTLLLIYLRLTDIHAYAPSHCTDIVM